MIQSIKLQSLIVNKHILALIFLPILFAPGSPVLASNFEWLPKGHSFPIQYLDPKAGQQGISTLTYAVEGEDQQRMYVPISLSMRQQFFRIRWSKAEWFELGMGFTIFNQFSIVDVGEAYMGGLQNADYRVSAIAVYQHTQDMHFRVSLFHQSSHLGDDYIIRNAITSQTLRTLNYEQLDLTYSQAWGGSRIYIGAGYNVSPNTVRGRLALQGGVDLTRMIKTKPGLAFKAASDLQFFEQNDFSPNFRVGAGMEFARQTQTPFILMLTWYQGNLPYSTLEYQKVELLGLSLFIDLPTTK